ncbi:MAG: ice-binding family protein [Sulfuricaulis sp.]
MNRFERITKPLMWSLVLLLVAFVAGCGNGGKDPILGGAGGTSPGAIPGAPPGAIIPGAVCTAAAGPTIPTVTSSNPTDGNLSTTTSTNGVAGSGKLVTATFSLAMNPTTINATTFTLTPVGGTVLTPASVSYNASTNVATLTTSSALLPATSYTAIITQGVATSATGTPIGCLYAWNFKTQSPAATGLAPVNLGLATPFGIAATAGVTNTGTLPNTTINGNVVLDPTATCNAVTVGATGSFGLCGGFAPTINGTVISPLFPDAGATAGAIKADLQAAFLSITPPAGPPAAGSLGGATNIPSGTTLGAPTGSALVQGTNLFVPGVYQSTTSILITGDLTLDAQGNPDAVFVFQSSSTVGTAAGAASPGVHTRILLINGAKASNVWWQAGTSATLGTFSAFQGNILASASITMNTGATSCGRLLAGAFTAGAFVFDANVVSVPGNVNAPASCQ